MKLLCQLHPKFGILVLIWSSIKFLFSISTDQPRRLQQPKHRTQCDIHLKIFLFKTTELIRTKLCLNGSSVTLFQNIIPNSPQPNLSLILDPIENSLKSCLKVLSQLEMNLSGIVSFIYFNQKDGCDSQT